MRFQSPTTLWTVPMRRRSSLNYSINITNACSDRNRMWWWWRWTSKGDSMWDSYVWQYWKPPMILHRSTSPCRSKDVSIVDIRERRAHENPFKQLLWHHRVRNEKVHEKHLRRSFCVGSCFHANALDPYFAHKIIGQFEGTRPLPDSSFLNFIEPGRKGVAYAIKSPTILIHFQPNVVGQLDEIALVNRQNNIREFHIDLFDVNQNLLFSNQTVYPQSSIRIPATSSFNPLFVSTVQITVLDTIDDRPARGIILSIVGCFSKFPSIPTTPVTTTVAPTTVATTTPRPRTQPPE